MLSNIIEYLKALPPPLGRIAKRALVYPRYWMCLFRAHQGWRKYGSRYKHPIIFIAGMPKSGTTWLEKMIASNLGYTELLIPSATFSELKNSQGHIFELPSGFHRCLKNCLIVLKMHCHGSVNNTERLNEAGMPYVIIYRDPRDVAISHYYYVRDTPWHGDYKALKNATLSEGIHFFIEKRLSEFSFWMRSWHSNRDHRCSLMISYEQMLNDPLGTLRSVFEMYDLPSDDKHLGEIINLNSIEVLRKRESAVSGFFREGKSGGWARFFDQSHRAAFKKTDGQILIDFNYEHDNTW